MKYKREENPFIMHENKKSDLEFSVAFFSLLPRQFIQMLRPIWYTWVSDIFKGNIP